MRDGSYPHALRHMTVGTEKVPENVSPDVGADAGQIHAHAAIATMRRGDRHRGRWGVAIHLAGNGHDAASGNGSTLPGRESSIIKQFKAATVESRAFGCDMAGIGAKMRSGPSRTSGDPLDKEVDDRLRRPCGLRACDAPAREMTVDVHSGKAINQRAAGDLDRFQVPGTELT